MTNNHSRVSVIENLKIKNNLFLGLALLYVSLFAANDWINVVDECLMSYATVVGLCLVNVSLFGWYWWVTGRATSVYRWVLVLQAGVGITNGVNFASRYNMLCNEKDFVFASTFVRATDYWLWKYRLMPETLALIYLTALIVARLCCSHIEVEGE